MKLPIPPQTNIVKALETEVIALRVLGEAHKVIRTTVDKTRSAKGKSPATTGHKTFHNR